MLKRTIKYFDFNGTEREEDFYFNLMKSEVMEMELGITGGMTQMLEKIVQTQDGPELVAVFKKLILMSYGEKSSDGKRFIKNKELAEAFSQTEAYTVLFMELATDAKAAAEFVNAILPKEATQNLSPVVE